MDAPHSFCYKMREDLAGEEVQRSAVRRPAAPPHHEDVFGLTKRWMHSEMAAAPVLVLPHDRLTRSHSPGPVQRKWATVQMTNKQKTELQDLAAHLESMSEDWGVDLLLSSCQGIARLGYRAVASASSAPLVVGSRPATPRACSAHTESIL